MVGVACMVGVGAEMSGSRYLFNVGQKTVDPVQYCSGSAPRSQDRIADREIHLGLRPQGLLKLWLCYVRVDAIPSIHQQWCP